MKIINVFFSIICIILIFASPAYSESYTKFLEEGEKEFDNRVQQNKNWLKNKKRKDAERNARSAAEHDDSNDFCYAIDNEDAQYACLDKPYNVSNLRAQNILLGNCYAFKTDTDLSKHLQFICTEGKKGCALLNDATAAHQCEQCGGTRRWLATYSLGIIIQCWK